MSSLPIARALLSLYMIETNLSPSEDGAIFLPINENTDVLYEVSTWL